MTYGLNDHSRAVARVVLMVGHAERGGGGGGGGQNISRAMHIILLLFKINFWISFLPTVNLH